MHVSGIMREKKREREERDFKPSVKTLWLHFKMTLKSELIDITSTYSKTSSVQTHANTVNL